MLRVAADSSLLDVRPTAEQESALHIITIVDPSDFGIEVMDFLI